MVVKYNELWTSRNGDSPYNDNSLTAQGSEWSDQLKGLKRIEIEKGFNNLTDSDFIKYPPNAMSFRDLCGDNDYEDVLGAIMARIRDGDSYNFTNRLAFSFWSRYSFELLGGTSAQVPKLVKQNLKMLDKGTLLELPDYSIKQIEEKENYISYSEWLKTQDKTKRSK